MNPPLRTFSTSETTRVPVSLFFFTLAALLALAPAAFGQTYFDITFEEAKHVVGQAPATGGADSPSVLFEGSPEVINFGGSKVLKFNAPLTTGGNYSNESIILNVAKNVGSYTVEYDVYTEDLLLAPSGILGQLFGITIRDNWDQNFFFQPLSNGPNLRHFQYPPPGQSSIFGTVGAYTQDRWYHVKIDVDTVAETWVITVDGSQVLSGPIYLNSDVGEIKFRLTDRDGIGDAIVYLDNITVTGPAGSGGGGSGGGSGNSYFDITFEEAKHVVGQAPATGGADSPSELFEGSPEVINFGGSKVLKFTPPIAAGTNFTSETIILDVAKNVESYSLEYDLYLDNLVLPPSGVTGELFSTNLFDNANQRLYFQPLTNGPKIYYFQSSPSHPNPPALTGTIGAYVQDRWYHVEIDVDTVAKTWVITVDGVQLHSGPIYLDSDVDEIRFRVIDRDSAGDAVVYLDNIKVTGPPPPPPPEPPAGVTATNGNHTDRVAVSWNQVGEATGYRIFRSTSDDSAGATEIGNVGETGSYNDFTAVAGTQYYYWVKSENANGIGDFSASDAGIRLAPPIQVTGVTASDGTSTSHVALSWTLTPYTGTYRIYRSTTSSFGDATQVHEINPPPTNSWNDTSAVADQIYHYWVRAANSAGDGPLSDPDTGFRIGVPAAPANVIASDGTSTDHTSIIWDAATGADAYRVYRSDVDDSSAASFLTTTTGTFLNDASGAPGQIYFYFVRATNIAGTSPYSASDAGFKLGPPGPPGTVTATDSASFDKVTLNWDASDSATSYRVYRSATNNPAGAVEIGNTPTTSFEDFTADPGESYFYWIRAENAAGLGSFSASDPGQRSIATPDLHIGKNAAAKIGDDVYSDTGVNQRIRQISRKGKKLHYYFCAENDGTVTDTLTLTGTPGNRLFRALYRDENGANVSAAVIAGAFQSNLNPAEVANLKLEVKPGRPAIGKRKRRAFVVRIVSTEDVLKSDAGHALAETKKERKKKR